MTQAEKRDQYPDIRPATPEDAREIWLAATAVRLTPGEFSQSGNGGFLIFVPPEDEYAKRLSGTKTALIAEIGGDLVGYVLAYRSTEFSEAGKADDPVITRILERETGPFVYIDQIVVIFEYRRRGIAQLLISHLGEIAQGHPQYAAIATAPVQNTASLRLFRDILGWKQVDSIKIGKVSGTIYKQIIKNNKQGGY